MAQGGHQRIIGDYVVTQQIGSGSFAVVWRARHRFTGNEVAIKEIATERLNKKLQDSLLSEIAILRRTNHPNIIRLHEIVEAPNIIYLVLEYCAGGDLAAYIQRCGRVSEAVARHFMCQLGAGLQVLRANNLIHRDLKPQNLLLSTNDSNAVLKIADFGFARSLQPQGLAETLCGSPLYMAPEILQFQKYDAKADLWSVGAILFQLVTGRPPYCGNSHAQLLQNIVKSNDLRFPEGILAELHPDCIDMCRKLLRRNPVERLSFEEFFSHKFMGQQIRHHSGPGIDATSGGSPFIPDTSENSQEDCLPFLLDEEPWGPSGSSLSSKQNIFPASPSATLFQNDAAVGRRVVVVSSIAHQADTLMKQVQAIAGPIYSESEIDCNRQSLGSSHRLQKEFENEYSKAAATEEVSQVKGEQESFHTSFSKGALMDSLECIEREYVLVNAPLSSTETLSLSLSDQSAGKVDRSPRKHPQKGSIVSVPVPILFGEVSSGAMGSTESPGSVPSETSQGSLDFAEVVEKPSIHPPTRLQSLKTCARVITQLVNDKLDAGQYLEAFSIQLVCLAVWKEALQVCHKWADGASGSCSKFRDQTENIEAQGSKDFPTFNEGSDEVDQEGAAAVACMHMEQEFFSAVEQAEQFASHIDFLDGNAEMPDALEIIFQSALALGKIAAVDELLENVTNAAAAYSKSATLLYFLLIEATSLPLNPPLVLTPSDRQRLQRYVDVLTARQNQSTVHRRSLLQQDDQQCHSSI